MIDTTSNSQVKLILIQSVININTLFVTDLLMTDEIQVQLTFRRIDPRIFPFPKKLGKRELVSLEIVYEISKVNCV